jgi:hypothetical protein
MEAKLACPYCGQTALSSMRKLALGPASLATCRGCGKKVSVARSALLAAVPFLAAILLARLADSWPLQALVVLVGWALLTFLHLVLVPLVPGEGRMEVTRLDVAAMAVVAMVTGVSVYFATGGSIPGALFGLLIGAAGGLVASVLIRVLGKR